MSTEHALGFIGLGVMGGPMCRNLARKSGARVVAFDARAEALAELEREGVEGAASPADVAQRAAIVFLCLPGEPQVRAVCLGRETSDGIAAHYEGIANVHLDFLHRGMQRRALKQEHAPPFLQFRQTAGSLGPFRVLDRFRRRLRPGDRHGRRLA